CASARSACSPLSLRPCAAIQHGLHPIAAAGCRIKSGMTTSMNHHRAA
ncbi:MAG: hypothetical protein AVDCRST_MAG51-360, partial [uncultured Ramlibacter sp.]